jgi:hypothetical protein
MNALLRLVVGLAAALVAVVGGIISLVVGTVAALLTVVVRAFVPPVHGRFAQGLISPAQRTRRRLIAATVNVTMVWAAFWLWACYVREEFVGLSDAGEVWADMPRTTLIALLAITILVGLHFTYALYVAAVEVFGKWRGIVAFALALAACRVFDFAGVLFAAFLIWKLGKPPEMAAAPALQRDSADRAS